MDGMGGSEVEGGGVEIVIRIISYAEVEEVGITTSCKDSEELIYL